jgi:Beta-lactamase enzyme family
VTIPRIPAFVLPVAVAGAVVVGHLAVGPQRLDDGSAGPSSGQRLLAAGIARDDRERVAGTVRYLPLGRARLIVVARHPARVHWGERPVRWYVGLGGKGLKAVAKGRTREPAPGVTRTAATVDLARAGRFRFTARFTGPSGSPYVGRGVAPAGYPRRAAIASAGSYLAGRDGYTSFAVVDSEGRMHGSHLHRTFVSASVVKAMLLVAYLREVAGAHRALGEEDRELLQPMIHYSDNEAASAVWELVGNPRLRALARRAGMTDFSIEGDWASAQISAADQARYFFGMRELIPARFRHLADHLLSHIAGYESWGVPAVARPRGWRVYFKGGWRGTWRGQLVHQIAWLRKPHERVAIAVMTDGDPSMEYGIGTIQGVTRRLLGARHG